jgi:hypothetical protein
MTPLDAFLDTWFPVPGIVAAAIRLPDQRTLTRRDGDALASSQVEQTLNRLVLAVDGLRRHRLEPHTLCWTFERASIHLARRPDGAWLALFATRGAAAPEPREVARLLREFHEARGTVAGISV